MLMCYSSLWGYMGRYPANTRTIRGKTYELVNILGVQEGKPADSQFDMVVERTSRNEGTRWFCYKRA